MPVHLAPVSPHSIRAGLSDSHRPVPPAATTSSPRGTRVGSPLHARLTGPSRDVSSEPGSPLDVSIGSARPVSINVDPHDLGTASAVLVHAPQIGEDSGVGHQAPTAERAPPRGPYSEVPSSLSDGMPDLVPDIASRAHSPQLPQAIIAPLGLEQDLKMLPGATRNRYHRHTCPVCGQFYRRPYLLKDHMASHQPTNGKRYICDFAECGLTFTSRSNMKRHFRQKHHDVGDTRTDSSPVASTSFAGNSIKPRALEAEGSRGSNAEQKITNSPIPATREADNGPIRKQHLLQPLLNDSSVLKTATDPSQEPESELTSSKNRKRSGETKYAPRVKFPCYGSAYTPNARAGNMTQLSCGSSTVDKDYRAFTPEAKDDLKGNGATRIIGVDLQAADIEPRYEAQQLSYTRDVLNPSIDASECVAPILTPVSQIALAGPMEMKHLLGGEDTRTDQDMSNVHDSDTTMAVMTVPYYFTTEPDCDYMHVVNGTVNAKDLAPRDSVGPIELSPFMHLGSPIHRPHLKVPNRLVQAVETVINYATTVMIPVKHFDSASTSSPTNFLSGASVFPRDHRPQMSQEILTSVSHFLRALSLVLDLPEPETNMRRQDVSKPPKQLLDVSLASLNALLPLARSEGVSDNITHALLKSLLLAQARAGLLSFPANFAGTRCKQPHLSPSPLIPVVSRPLFNQANPDPSTGTLVIVDPCTPGSTKFRARAPGAPRFTTSTSFPFSTKVKPSYPNLLPKLEMNWTTNSRAWRLRCGLAAWNFNHKLNLSASHATEQTLAMDTTSMSTPRAPVPQCVPVPTTDTPQPVPETSLEFNGKDHQRHTCASCGRTFRRPYLLKDHMQSKHRNGERPYACDFEECNRAFSTRSNLRKHFRAKHTDLGRIPIVSETNID